MSSEDEEEEDENGKEEMDVIDLTSSSPHSLGPPSPSTPGGQLDEDVVAVLTRIRDQLLAGVHLQVFAL